MFMAVFAQVNVILCQMTFHRKKQGPAEIAGLVDNFNAGIEVPAEAKAAYDAALAGILSGEIMVEVE